MAFLRSGYAICFEPIMVGERSGGIFCQRTGSCRVQ
jgi:hypothetical protein